MLRNFIVKNIPHIPTWLVLVTSLNFLSCQPDEPLKEISIRSKSVFLDQVLEGEVMSLNEMGGSTRIILDTGHLDVSPPVEKWPKQFRIKVGERVILSSQQTIGNKSQSLSVGDKGDIRLRIVEGAFFPILIPGKNVRYYVKPGDPIGADTSIPRLSTSLVLTLEENGDIFIVQPGEKVNLGEWELYLIRMSQLNPKFQNPGIAQEQASFDFDYVLYRKN